MNLFFDITRYELKKILCKKRNIVAFAIIIFLSTVSIPAMIIGNRYYIDKNGNEIAVSRYEEEIVDRLNGEALSGRAIDADLIMEAVEAYRQVPIDGYYINTTEYRNIAKKYRAIYQIVYQNFHLNSIEEFQAITQEQAQQFDQIRKENMEDMMESASISNNIKAYWQKCFDKSPKTLLYEYIDGYSYFTFIIFYSAISAGAAIAIMFSSIFSNEYASGADSLILSSKHGKGLVIGAKLFTVFVISAVLIFLPVVISYVEAMIIWGGSGANANITLLGNIFPYSLTVGQSVLLYLICVVMACLLFATITAMLSAIIKAPFNTIVIMSVFLIAPMFINVPSGAPIWALNLENLLPTNMMAFWGALYEYQYEIFGLVIPPYIFLPIFSVIVSVVCSYAAYLGFKKHQSD